MISSMPMVCAVPNGSIKGSLVAGEDLMAVALVLNGIPDLQSSMAEGLECLTVLLSDRQSRGCTIAPTEQATFGTEYRIQHPGNGVETVYLTDYPDPANQDWDIDG
jgi:hypothetical protein